MVGTITFSAFLIVSVGILPGFIFLSLINPRGIYLSRSVFASIMMYVLFSIIAFMYSFAIYYIFVDKYIFISSLEKIFVYLNDLQRAIDDGVFYEFIVLIFLHIVAAPCSMVIFHKLVPRKWLSETAWDFINGKFKSDVSYFVVAEMKDNRRICGISCKNSFLSSNHGNKDIYLEKVYTIEKNGRPGNAISEIQGIWINGNEIKALSFYQKNNVDNGSEIKQITTKKPRKPIAKPRRAVRRKPKPA